MGIVFFAPESVSEFGDKRHSGGEVGGAKVMARTSSGGCRWDVVVKDGQEPKCFGLEVQGHAGTASSG